MGDVQVLERDRLPEAADIGMRERAKAMAARLLVVHGFRGFSFGILAESLNTTRANLHYHFGSKMRMVEEIIDEYAAETAARFRTVWRDRHLSFCDKVLATYAINRDRYEEFNVSGEGRPWSLIARMRNDFDVLSPAAVERLRAFTREMNEDVRKGVRLCMERGDLVAGTPVDDVALQIASVINSAGPITQDAASIERLERVYQAFLTTVLKAYGPGGG